MANDRVYRTVGGQRVPGFSIPGFIRNGTHFFTELGVYRDGAFDCWGGVDLDFLERKLAGGWIAPSIPDGAQFSAYALISGTVVSGEWLADRAALRQRLLDALDALDPVREQLIDFEGSDVEIREGVRYAKLGWLQGDVLRLDEAGAPIPTDARFGLVRDEGRVFLTSLRMYADGLVDIGARVGQEQLVDLESFRERVGDDRVCLGVEDGEPIEIDTVGRFTLEDSHCLRSRSDLVADVSDRIQELAGADSLVHVCREVYDEYQVDPSDANRKRLRQAYESIPAHQRCYVGDMDTRDRAVRRAIYEDGDDD